MSIEAEYIRIARAVDRHVERKSHKMLGPHVAEFAQVIVDGDGMKLQFMHTGLIKPVDGVYFTPALTPGSLVHGDVVMTVGVFNEDVVVGRVTLGYNADLMLSSGSAGPLDVDGDVTPATRFDGGIGASTYTIGEVVAALKLLGLLAF